MAATDRTRQLDQLLGTGIAGIDIPDYLYTLAMARYEDVASFLSDWWPEGTSGGRIYPQGSARLGTMVAPLAENGQYDVDLVVERAMLPSSISKLDLKRETGNGLMAYVKLGPDGLPRLTEGKRCWTLGYPHDLFHMDTLPALPDPKSPAWSNAILLADKEMHEWQSSNPIDFAVWFDEQMQEAVTALREAVAKRMEIEDAPPSVLKTTLQRTVQALKRHRDIYFVERDDDGPASIIITTLAGRAYRSGGSLYEVLNEVTTVMPDMVEFRNGRYWIPNPVNEEENFADRWDGRPDRSEAFFTWMEQAQADFAQFGDELGVDRVLTKLSESLGETVAKQAREGLGTSLRSSRDSGELKMGRTGLLGTAGAATVRPHTFHGHVASSPERP